MTTRIRLLKKFKLYFNTLKYLKFKQLFYFLKRIFVSHPDIKLKTIPKIKFPELVESIDKPNAFKEGQFKFLNESIDYKKDCWWLGSQTYLWHYNINYFDFINSSSLCPETSTKFINDWIDCYKKNKYAKDPYPASLRLVNWVKFFSKNQDKLDSNIISSIYKQASLLYRTIEYHIAANHLLTNAKALLFCGFFFDDENSKKFIIKGLKILNKEIDEQFFIDGCHYERTPSYQTVMLEDLLDIYNLLSKKTDNCYIPDRFIQKLKQKIKNAYKFTAMISYKNKYICLFNDSSKVSTVNLRHLKKYYFSLIGEDQESLPPSPFLSASNFLIYELDDSKFISSCGPASPDYQPGHFHDGIFAFELFHKGKKLITNLGVSTYEKSIQRLNEKSLAFQSTFSVESKNANEIWSAFRLARRSQVKKIFESPDEFSFSQNGFDKIHHIGIHTRTFKFKGRKISINDILSSKNTYNCCSRFFVPKIFEITRDKNCIYLERKGEKYIKIKSQNKITVSNKIVPIDFGQLGEVWEVGILSNLDNKINMDLELL